MYKLHRLCIEIDFPPLYVDFHSLSSAFNSTKVLYIHQKYESRSKKVDITIQNNQKSYSLCIVLPPIRFSYFPLNDFSRITTTCILALRRSIVRSLYLVLISSIVKLAWEESRVKNNYYANFVNSSRSRIVSSISIRLKYNRLALL